MKNQSTRKLEKDLLKLHTKYFTNTDKLTILHDWHTNKLGVALVYEKAFRDLGSGFVVLKSGIIKE